jgi:hypothetical protein
LAQITSIVTSEKACQLFLYAQAQITCDDYDHDHHTDDVKDVHCVLLRVRDAICLRDGPICDWRPRLVLS